MGVNNRRRRVALALEHVKRQLPAEAAVIELKLDRTRQEAGSLRVRLRELRNGEPPEVRDWSDEASVMEAVVLPLQDVLAALVKLDAAGTISDAAAALLAAAMGALDSHGLPLSEDEEWPR